MSDDRLDHDVLAREASQASLTRSGLLAYAEHCRGRDLDAALELALTALDGRAVTMLCLAAAQVGRPIGGAMLARALPFVDALDHMLVLIGRAPDDPVPVLLDLCASGVLHSDRQSLVLFAVAERRRGTEPPRALRIQLRRHAHRRLTVEQGVMLGIAASAVDDPHLEQIAAPWIVVASSPGGIKMREQLQRCLRLEPLETLPEHEAAPQVDGPVRRSVPKVGRNDTCPCGSGKKYKKCCADQDAARLRHSSPVPGLTVNEYVTRAHEFMPDAEFRALRPSALVRLPLERLSTLQLIAAYRTFTAAHCWPHAERILELMAGRELPGAASVDGYREELIDEALQARDAAVAERQLLLVTDPEIKRARNDLGLVLLKDRGEALRVLEEATAIALRDGEDLDSDLLTLAFLLLDAYPAIGIVFARNALDPERPLDSEVLLDAIEDARDELLLPPTDPAREAYWTRAQEHLDREMTEAVTRENQELRAQVEGKRSDVQRSLEQVRRLEAELATRQQQLDRTRSALEETRAATVVMREREPGADAELLRARVRELKGEIAEGHATRRDLERELAKLAEKVAAERQPQSEARRHDDELEDAQEDRSAGLRERLPVLIPRFTAAAEHALLELEAAVARRALKVAAALAGGDAAAWLGVKPMATANGLWSARVGRDVRMLFQIDSDRRALDIVEVISRGALETTLKRYR